MFDNTIAIEQLLASLANRHSDDLEQYRNTAAEILAIYRGTKKAVIVMNDGSIQIVLSEVPLEVMVIERDVEFQDEEDIIMIQGEQATGHIEDSVVNQDRLDQYFREFAHQKPDCFSWFCDSQNCKFSCWSTSGDGWHEPRMADWSCAKDEAAELEGYIDFSDNPKDYPCPCFEAIVVEPLKWLVIELNTQNGPRIGIIQEDLFDGSMVQIETFDDEESANTFSKIYSGEHSIPLFDNGVDHPIF